MISYLFTGCTSDVLMAISWFYQLKILKIGDDGLNGFLKVSKHISNDDKRIRESVINCYNDVFFGNFFSNSQSAFALMEFARKCDIAEAESLVKIMCQLDLPEEIQQILWKISFLENTHNIDEYQQTSALTIMEIISRGKPNKIDAKTLSRLLNLINDSSISPLALHEVLRRNYLSL